MPFDAWCSVSKSSFFARKTCMTCSKSSLASRFDFPVYSSPVYGTPGSRKVTSALTKPTYTQLPTMSNITNGPIHRIYVTCCIEDRELQFLPYFSNLFHCLSCCLYQDVCPCQRAAKFQSFLISIHGNNSSSCLFGECHYPKTTVACTDDNNLFSGCILALLTA